MSAFSTIDFEVQGAVAVLTLERPHVVNAFDTAMRDDLHEALCAARDDPGIGGLLLRGAGDNGFCAGADLSEFGTTPSQVVARQVRRERDVWGLLATLDKPVVAALHGYCLGSGLELACLCDIRVASDDLIVGMPEASLGLLPAAGGTQMLPRIVGEARALELLLTGRRVTADEAVAMGLVSRVVRRERLDDEGMATLHRVMDASWHAVQLAKRAIIQGGELPLAQALALEARLAEVARA